MVAPIEFAAPTCSSKRANQLSGWAEVPAPVRSQVIANLGRLVEANLVASHLVSPDVGVVRTDEVQTEPGGSLADVPQCSPTAETPVSSRPIRSPRLPGVAHMAMLNTRERRRDLVIMAITSMAALALIGGFLGLPGGVAGQQRIIRSSGTTRAQGYRNRSWTCTRCLRSLGSCSAAWSSQCSGGCSRRGGRLGSALPLFCTRNRCRRQDRRRPAIR
jgi:hypothetical protein